MHDLKLPETFSDKEKKLAKQVHIWHHPQQRKYTKLPYSTHLIRVAELVQTHTQDAILVASALCHDLLEDTNVTKEALQIELIAIGYQVSQAQSIVKIVIELTDVYLSLIHI